MRTLILASPCLLAGCQHPPPANDQLDAVLWTWLGQRWFLLPNPTYGNWYSAPYKDDEKLPFERKRQLKQQALDLQE
jgi:hypothetical protein